ncbi:MAG: chitinase [Candidatus Rickettsia vulgarisii]
MGNTQKSYPGDLTISNYYKPYINNIRGDVIISFGGAANLPIENYMTNIGELISNYSDIIKNYSLKAIGFDFEGSFLADNTALNRHIVAITEVIQENPELKISYTLSVNGAPGLMGLNLNGEIFLKKLSEAGIKPSLINAMFMEFSKDSNTNYFECIRFSIEGTNSLTPEVNQRGLIRQIEEIYPGRLPIGIFPMFGRNINGKIFTLEDQQKLNKYSLEKNIAVLTGWDATRDMNYTSQEIGLPNHKSGDFSIIIAEYNPELLGESSE